MVSSKVGDLVYIRNGIVLEHEDFYVCRTCYPTLGFVDQTLVKIKLDGDGHVCELCGKKEKK